MRVCVLRIYSLLVSNIHHRLLPEGAVRTPITRLITFCHQLDDTIDLEQMRLELVKLIDVIFHQLKSNPALMNLFISQQKASAPSTEGPAATLVSPTLTFPIFTFLFDYISSPNETVRRLAREALTIGVQLLCSDDHLANFLIQHSKLSAMITQKLIILYSMMPTVLPNDETAVLSPRGPRASAEASTTGQVSGSMLSPSSSSHSLVDGDQGMESRVVVEFFEFWQFVNDLVMQTTQPIVLSAQAGPFKRGPLSGMRSSRSTLLQPSNCADRVRSQIIQLVHNTFFRNFLATKWSPTEGVEKEAEFVTSMEYLCEMILGIRDSKMLDAVLQGLLYGTDGDMTTFSHTLLRKTASKSDQVSVSAFRLFDCLLDTYHPALHRRLVLEDLPAKEDSIPALRVYHSFRLLEMASLADTVWIEVFHEGGSQPPVLNAAKNYDAYFSDAQRRSQKCFDAVFGNEHDWSRPIPESERANINFLDIIQSQFETFFNNSSRKNLLLTSMLGKIAHVPLPSVQHWVMGSGEAGAFGVMNMLERLHERCRHLMQTIPDFRSKLMTVYKYCGDDMIAILHNLSTQQTSSASGDPEISDDQTSFAIFLPAFLILAEFCKELAATLMVVHRSLGLKQLDHGPAMDEEMGDAIPYPVEVTGPSPGKNNLVQNVVLPINDLVLSI